MILSSFSLYITYTAQDLEKKKNMANPKAAYNRHKHEAEANVHVVADNWSKKSEKLEYASVRKSLKASKTA